MTDTFKALIVDQQDGETTADVREMTRDSLPAEGDVVVAVAYSSLNYKDGLAVTGKAKVLRSFPMVPGIDLAGTVVESKSPDFNEGDAVILTGFETGERYWGGFTQLNRVRSETLVPLPEGMTLKEAMTVGTAGLTAMLSVLALEQHGLMPEEGRQVLVTGASGGVGSMAVAILGELGHDVVASTGKKDAHAYLESLGASDFFDREELAAPSKRPLEAGRWAGAVDAVGGDTLAGLLRSMAPHSSVALSGNAGGVALNSTVLPFILRGVNLLGIDSNFAPMDKRIVAWQRLSDILSKTALAAMAREASLEDVPALSKKILAGAIQGRTVIKVG
ncbi:oxidoreductase [Gemmatimonadota bacterium]